MAEIANKELEAKRKERRKETAEDFTPTEIVNEMLDKLPENVWHDASKTFLDNSAGIGNLLVAVLERKLEHKHDPIAAISTLYGVELMPDNVDEIKKRLFTRISDKVDPSQHDRAWKILNHNIVCHDSLDWDFDNWKPLTPKQKALF